MNRKATLPTFLGHRVESLRMAGGDQDSPTGRKVRGGCQSLNKGVDFSRMNASQNQPGSFRIDSQVGKLPEPPHGKPPQGGVPFQISAGPQFSESRPRARKRSLSPSLAGHTREK